MSQTVGNDALSETIGVGYSQKLQLAVIVSCKKLFFNTARVKLPEAIGTSLIFDQNEEELAYSHQNGEFYLQNVQANQNITVYTASLYAVEDQDGALFAFNVSRSVTDLSDRNL